VVVASARKLLAAVPRVIAVVPPRGWRRGALLAALGCEVTVCPDADSGMAASLVHAIRHSLPDAHAWLVALGDMPHVAPATCEAAGLRWLAARRSPRRSWMAGAATRSASAASTWMRCWPCRATRARAGCCRPAPSPSSRSPTPASSATSTPRRFVG
jgi:CTP:molybdopterin cytidylyltransferase MocA